MCLDFLSSFSQPWLQEVLDMISGSAGTEVSITFQAHSRAPIVVTSPFQVFLIFLFISSRGVIQATNPSFFLSVRL